MYFDEDLVLDFRLNILKDHVNNFVIAEATKDHTGKDKKLNFNINHLLIYRNTRSLGYSTLGNSTSQWHTNMSGPKKHNIAILLEDSPIVNNESQNGLTQFLNNNGINKMIKHEKYPIIKCTNVKKGDGVLFTPGIVMHRSPDKIELNRLICYLEEKSNSHQ